MRFVFRWFFRIAIAAVAFVVLAATIVYFLASGSLPDYNKTLAVNGISAPVDITRDHSNVPHITGASDADIYFGLGYAHAQDRLWQMLVQRWAVQGRLSEVFGARTAQTDSFIRRLGLYDLAVRAVDVQTPETRTALDAYAAGVNARLTEINENSLGRGAPELFLFNAPIAPWQPADSIAMLKLMALTLAGHLDDEILRARVSLQLNDPARLEDIMPQVPGQAINALPNFAALFPNTKFAANVTATPEGYDMMPSPPRDFAGASNAWAAAPSRSASGGTLLANDPHLAFSAPSIWYLAQMELASGGVIGATIPGIPTILSGRSSDLGWGLTSSYLDDQDLHIEQINPDNPDEYLTPEGYKPFETARSIINIKDADPITLTLRWTENGPVLPGSFNNLESITPAGHVVSLNWTALEPNDTTMSAAIALMQAKDIETALLATKLFVAPSQNITMVDKSRIAMKTVGRMPQRSLTHQSQGRIPSPGWIEENRWKGYFDDEQNPLFLDPIGGILGNTNNKVIDRPFPNHLSFSWGDSQRILRWQRLMQGRKVHTRDSFVEAQLDTVSTAARTLLPLVGAELWYTGPAAPEGTPERQMQKALDLLASWNGEMNEHMPEPLIYAAWMRALQKRLIQDDLGTLEDEFPHMDPLFIERVYRNVDGAGKWCDIQQSVAQETCADMARLALSDALTWISERWGTNLESLRWGDAHQATHDHKILGQLPILRYFVNIRQSTSGGDQTLLRGRTSGKDPNPFENVHGAAYRGVYDFADPDSSVFIISTGQSGHFLSRYYDNLGQLWRRGEYIPMSLDLELARAAAVGVTHLTPAQ